MKLFLLLLACFPLMAIAQVQKGVVKTKGKMVNGALVPGQGLKGAMVSVKGGKKLVTQNSNGTFEFHVPSTTFSIDSVRKNGYQLIDFDVTRKLFTYSRNPFFLVMETPSQLLEDKLTAERKIRKTLMKQMSDKEDEIEALKAQLTQEEYLKAVQQLYAEQERNEKLISEMADQYSRIDFDSKDDFNRKITECIFNGHLTEADSLLRTKGDVQKRAADIKKHQEANSEEQQRISRLQRRLEKSKLLAQKELEDLAQDCYNLFEIFKLQHKLDSAAYYIEFRANLDTMNISWLKDAGSFFLDYCDNREKAFIYYTKMLNQAISQHGEQSEWAAIGYNNVASTYNIQDSTSYTKGIQYFNKAISIYEKKKDYVSVASVYNNMGVYALSCGKRGDANRYFDDAVIWGSNADDTEEISKNKVLISIYNNIGTLCYDSGDYYSANGCFTHSLHISERILGKEHPTTATIYNNLGNAILQDWYSDHCIEIEEDNHRGKHSIREMLDTFLDYFSEVSYSNAMNFLSKGMMAREKLYGINHIYTASSYNNIGSAYYLVNEYDSAMTYFTKALHIYENTTCNLDLASVYNNIGLVLLAQKDYDTSRTFFQRAIHLCDSIYPYRYNHASYYYNDIASAFYGQKDYTNAATYLLKSIEAKDFPSQVSRVRRIQSNMACIYNLLGNYQQALSLFLSLQSKLSNFSSMERCWIGGLYELNDSSLNAVDIYFKQLWHNLPSLNERLNDANLAVPQIGFFVSLNRNLLHDNEIDDDYIEMLSYYQNVIQERERILGTNHFATAVAYNNLADIYFIGRIKDPFWREKAIDNYKKALNIKRNCMGENHPSVAITLLCLAACEKNVEETLHYMERTLAILKNFYNEGDEIITKLTQSIHDCKQIIKDYTDRNSTRIIRKHNSV